MITYNFVCPQCKYQDVQEIATEVTLSSDFTTVTINDNNDIFLDYQGDETDDGVINRYECANCRYVLVTKENQCVNSYEKLKKWMEEYGVVNLSNDYLSDNENLN